MPVSPKSCFEVTCDQEKTEPSCDGGWDEGALHFETEKDAIETARTYGFVIVGDSVLCPSCARKRECERLGHKWEDWTDQEYLGVAYQRRDCEHCDATEHSPEYELAVLMHQTKMIVDNPAAAGDG